MRFKTGETYHMRSVGDHNCVWNYIVARRTDRSIWIVDADRPNEEPARRAVKRWGSVEQCLPLGSFAMAPVLGADKPGRGVRDWEGAVD